MRTQQNNTKSNQLKSNISRLNVCHNVWQWTSGETQKEEVNEERETMPVSKV